MFTLISPAANASESGGSACECATPSIDRLLGTPPYSFASALSEARGLVFVGKTPNKLDFRGLPIDGYTPPCL